MFKRDDIFCLDDIRMYKLSDTGERYANSSIYKNNDYVVLFELLDFKKEPLYRIRFSYKNE